MSQTAAYRIEPGTEDHYPALLALYRSAYGADIDLETLRKKYDTSALGGPLISFVAIYEADHSVVSHFGASPVPIRIHGSIVPAAQSIDAATSAAHRNKGLFARLAVHVHQACRNRGISMVFSQPNGASYHAFMKTFHFEEVDQIVRWDMKLRVKTLPLFKISHKREAWRSLYFSYARRVLSPYLIAPPENFSNPLPVEQGRIERGRAYLQYKASPDKFFLQIGEVIVWVKLTDVLWIGEFSDYSKVDKAVLGVLKRIAFLAGFNTISFHLNERVEAPSFLQYFRKYKTEPSCFLYLDQQYKGQNIILTGADFDTW